VAATFSISSGTYRIVVLLGRAAVIDGSSGFCRFQRITAQGVHLAAAKAVEI
jgi:hypothetical protein